MIYITEKGESLWDAHTRLIRDKIIPEGAKIALRRSDTIPENIIGYISVRRKEQFALYLSQSEQT